MRISWKDVAAGLVFVAFGLSFVVTSFGYEVGTAREMGPGYFPAVIGGMLAVFGAGLSLFGLRRPGEGTFQPPNWRSVFCLLVAILLFGALVQPLGLVPALFVAVALSALGSKGTSVVAAAALGAALTVLCVVLFVYGLGAAIPLLGPVFGQ